MEWGWPQFVWALLGAPVGVGFGWGISKFVLKVLEREFKKAVAKLNGLPDGATITNWLERMEQRQERMEERQDEVLSQIETKVDRIEVKVDGVEAKVDVLPKADRLEEHLKMGHLHAQAIHEHGLRLTKVEKVQDDHEARIRDLELRRDLHNLVPGSR